jgi:Zn finger protein HypA/HybF involved in hydrogenase expression
MRKYRDTYVPEPIERECLRCRKTFQSKDRKKNWLCGECTNKNKNIHDKAPIKTQTGRRTKESFSD